MEVPDRPQRPTRSRGPTGRPRGCASSAPRRPPRRWSAARSRPGAPGASPATGTVRAAARRAPTGAAVPPRWRLRSVVVTPPRSCRRGYPATTPHVRARRAAALDRRPPVRSPRCSPTTPPETTTSTPGPRSPRPHRTRWRDGDDDWSEPDGFAETLSGDDARVGALDDWDRPTHDDLFTFDDLDDVVEQRAAQRVADRAHEVDGSSLFAPATTTPRSTRSSTSRSSRPRRRRRVRAGGPGRLPDAEPRRPQRRRPSRPAADERLAAGAARRGRRPRHGHGRGRGRRHRVVALIFFASARRRGGAGHGRRRACRGRVLRRCAAGGPCARGLVGLVASVTFPLATTGAASPPCRLVLAYGRVLLLWYLVGAGGERRC